MQYLKSDPDDCHTADSLRFLLTAMNALKKKNPLTESFLVQLDVDLEALGLRIPKLKSAFPRSTDSVGLCLRSPSPDERLMHATEQPTPGLSIPPMHHGMGPDGTPNSSNCPRTGVEAVFEDQGCNYMAYEKGNPITAPDLVEPERRNQNNDASHANPFGAQQWYSGERQMASGEQIGGADNGANGVVVPPMMYTRYVEARGSDANDMSASSNPDGQSNRPTPKSSSNASDQRRGAAGGASFNASPIGSHQNLGIQETDMDTSRTSFFPDHGFGTNIDPNRTFAIPDTPNNDFNIPNGWEPGQAGMTPRTAEALIQGLAMDGLEMNWDAGT